MPNSRKAGVRAGKLRVIENVVILMSVSLDLFRTSVFNLLPWSVALRIAMPKFLTDFWQRKPRFVAQVGFPRHHYTRPVKEGRMVVGDSAFLKPLVKPLAIIS